MSYQLASRSGDESQFIDMVQHCRGHGIDIYVDVVINHMAGGSLEDPGAVGRAGTPWRYRWVSLQEFCSASWEFSTSSSASLPCRIKAYSACVTQASCGSHVNQADRPRRTHAVPCDQLL